MRHALSRRFVVVVVCLGMLSVAMPASAAPAPAFEILDALVVASPLPVGSACPSPTTANHSASPGATGQTIAICGRNLTNVPRIPLAANSSLGGTLIAAPGTFTSGLVAVTEGSVVLGNWTGVTINSFAGPAMTVIAQVGFNPAKTSPLTTLSGYNTNQAPVAAAASATTDEDTASGPITLSANEPNGNPVTFSIASGPAHGTLGPISAAPCLSTEPAAHTCTATVVYTPAPDYNGADSFTYIATDSFGISSAPATVSLTVSPVNDGPPTAVLTTDRTNGALPLAVEFSSAGSSDVDPDPLSFAWDFGDGSPISTEPNPSHTYTTGGQYTATLTVTDSGGLTATLATIITAGNTAPMVVVLTPVAGGTFAFGDDIPFTIAVTDDTPINCAEVSVTFVLGHDTHGHAEDSVTGCEGVLQTEAGDASHGGHLFGVVSATYTDHGNGAAPPLTTVTQTVIRLKRQEVEFVDSQSGTTTAVTTDFGGGLHRGSLGDGDWIQLNGPFNLVNIDSITYRVADPAAGRTAGSPLARIEIHRDTVDGPIVQSADLVSTGATVLWSSQTFPIALSGEHELFLVFVPITGGATGGDLFNLNWVQFNGQGVAAP